MFENRVLRIYKPKREDVRGEGEDFIMRNLMTSRPHHILFRYLEELNGRTCRTNGSGA